MDTAYCIWDGISPRLCRSLQKMIYFSRSLLPRSVTKRPNRLRLENTIEWLSNCNKLYWYILRYVPGIKLCICLFYMALLRKRPRIYFQKRATTLKLYWYILRYVSGIKLYICLFYMALLQNIPIIYFQKSATTNRLYQNTRIDRSIDTSMFQRNIKTHL